MKIAVAAILMCAVMVLVAGAPLVTAITHHVVKGAQGPRASAVAWDYAPTESGVWTGHVVNSGLRSLVVDVNDITTGAASSILHQRIRFAVAGNDMYTSGAIMAKNHLYNITVIPNGPRGTSCTVDDVFTYVPPPVALFTASVAGAIVSVDGSASNDNLNPGASITGWGWEWGDGTIGTGMTASHRYTAANTYTITLTVLSSTGMTGSTSHDVTLVDSPPVASFTAIPISWTVSVDASASTDDFGIVSYDWNWGDLSAHGSGVTTTHKYAASGTYSITLTVTDTKGQTGVLTLQVVVSDIPPVALFTAIPDALTVSVGASASTDDFGIVSYDWNWGDLSADGSGVMTTHTYAASGDYTITLTVTDTVGQTNSASKLVHVVGGIPRPVASFTATVSGATVSVDGSASTSSAGALSYSWNWGDNVTGPSGVTASHTYLITKTYTITLTVTDTLGQTGTASKTVSVVNNVIPPLPFYVVGTTYTSDGVTPLAGCTITITDVRTGTTLIGTGSDDTGFYAGDISLLYQLVGDTLIVNVIGPAGQTGSGTGVIGTDPYVSINVTLSG